MHYVVTGVGFIASKFVKKLISDDHVVPRLSNESLKWKHKMELNMWLSNILNTENTYEN